MGVSEFLGVPYFGVLILRILLFRVLYWGPLFSETPISIWVVVKIMVPFLGTLNTRCRILLRTQKRDHNFDNHPYEGTLGNSGPYYIRNDNSLR